MARKTVALLAAGFLIGAGLGAVVFFGLLGGGERFGTAAQSQGNEPAIGSIAPDQALQTLAGETIKPSDFRGHPLLINFWATWCHPCLAEMPLIEQRYQQYAPRLVVLAVNANEPAERVNAFVEDRGLSFPVLLDPAYDFGNRYLVRGYPTTFFVDAQGVVRAIAIGELDAAEMDRYLATIGIEP